MKQKIQKLNTAIIGCGSISSMHEAAILNSGRANLVAVCDIDDSKAGKMAQKHNCKTFSDYKLLLEMEEIDVVHICTPHYLHAQMAIDAMRAGKHVLTEKPMAITVSDAEEMIRVSRQTGRVLGVSFQNRFNKTSRRVKELIESKQVGSVLGARAFLTWHRDKAYYSSGEWRGRWQTEGGGVLINQTIHTLDLLQWFMGDIDRLKATVDTRILNDVIEVEDTAEATIKFKSGAKAFVYATNGYPVDSPVILELACEKAVIRMEGDVTIRYSNGEVESISDVEKAQGEKAYWGCSHKELVQDFYTKLINGQHFEIDAEEGVKALKMVRAIYKSHKIHEYVELG